MTPTELQINQAERLQKAGLCQDSEQFIQLITDDEIQEFKGLYKIGKKANYWLKRNIIGPFITFEQAVKEATKLLKNSKGGDDYEYIYIDESGLSIQQINNYEVGEPLFESSKIDDNAAIEALLYLSGR